MPEPATAEHAARNGSGSARRVTDSLTGTGAGLGSKLLGAAGGIAGALARELQSRIPVADLDDRDPDFIREQLPLSWLAATLWHRAEVRNLSRIPENGPVLLVGNHTGGIMAPEVIVFTLAFSTYFGVERRFHQLAHNGVTAAPLLGSYLKRFGAVTADPENARTALAAGSAVLVFPGGDYEVFRPSWHGDKVDFGGRKGFIRLALEQKVPIVPVVSIGGQENALFLTRGQRIAKLLGIDKTMRLKSFPMGVALPFGLQPMMFGHLPLPTKVTIEVLPAIDLIEEFGPEPDVNEVYDHLMGEMQDTLSSLAAERRFPVLG